MKQKPFYQMAELIGASHPIFSAIKRSSPEKYEKIWSLHEDRWISLNLYIEQVKTLVRSMELVLESFEDRKRRDYGDMIVSLGFSDMESQWTSVIYATEVGKVYKIREDKDYLTITLDVIRKWEAIIEHLKIINNEE